jgi:hypothetical protein
MDMMFLKQTQQGPRSDSTSPQPTMARNKRGIDSCVTHAEIYGRDWRKHDVHVEHARPVLANYERREPKAIANRNGMKDTGIAGPKTQERRPS